MSDFGSLRPLEVRDLGNGNRPKGCDGSVCKIPEHENGGIWVRGVRRDDEVRPGGRSHSTEEISRGEATRRNGNDRIASTRISKERQGREVDSNVAGAVPDTEASPRSPNAQESATGQSGNQLACDVRSGRSESLQNSTQWTDQLRDVHWSPVQTDSVRIR